MNGSGHLWASNPADASKPTVLLYSTAWNTASFSQIASGSERDHDWTLETDLTFKYTRSARSHTHKCTQDDLTNAKDAIHVSI